VRKEVVMRSGIVKAVMAGAVLLLVSGTARAAETLDVNVPFQFLVNNQVFPAGHYMIEEDDVAGPTILIIRGTHNREAAFMLTHTASGRGPAGTGVAVRAPRKPVSSVEHLGVAHRRQTVVVHK
jgi:hypothetical protein